MNQTMRNKRQVASVRVRYFAVVMLVLALCYLAIIVYLYVNQRQLIYFPQFTRDVHVAPDFELEVDDVRLHGWVVQDGKRDAIIYFGGNGESIEAMRQSFSKWVPNHSTYLVPYRGYGPNAGTPDQQHLFSDALALFDAVEESHADGRIAVIGRSLGTGVASYIASRRKIDKLVLITPFDSMVSVASTKYPWLPVGWILNERFESSSYLRDMRVPTLILRAGRDEVIPLDSTQRLIAALPVTPEVVEFSQAGHNSISRATGYDDAISRFLISR